MHRGKLSRVPCTSIRNWLPILAILTMASSERILLLPFPWPSHYSLLEKIGMELLKRGHEVNVIMPSTEHYRGKTILNTTTYHVPKLASNTFVSIAENRLETASGFGIDWLVEYVSLLNEYGMALMDDQATAKQAMDADLVISDTAFLVAPIFASHYKLPLVFISPFGHLPGCMADVLGNMENPSYVHTFVATSLFEKIGFTQRMNFLQRSFNLFANVMSKILREYITVPILQPLTDRYSTKNFLNLWKETSMVLIPMDYSLEFPRPESPNVKMIGPLTTFDSKSPLPRQFEEIIQNSEQGVIVVSFGITSALHPKHVTVILNSLSKLRYTIIWRYNISKLKGILRQDSNATYSFDSNCYCGDSFKERNQSGIEHSAEKNHLKCNTRSSPQLQGNRLKIGENIHVFDWLPQQELLQQKKTIILITHCGINSLYEALFHTTQVICLPLFGEQFDNAGRVVGRNLGKALTLEDLTRQSLHKTIQDVIRDETSKNNVIKVSRRLRRSKESAAEKAAYWIEAVLEEKGDMTHLRPIGADLPFYIYFSVDVLLFWGLILIVVPIVIAHKVFRTLQ